MVWVRRIDWKKEKDLFPLEICVCCFWCIVVIAFLGCLFGCKSPTSQAPHPILAPEPVYYLTNTQLPILDVQRMRAFPTPVLSQGDFISKTAISGQSVSLTWDAYTNGTIAGFKVWYGTASRVYTGSVDAGTNTAVTVSNLAPGTVYFFSATAVGTNGQESIQSNEVTNSVVAPPQNLRITLIPQVSGSIGGPFTNLPIPAILLTNGLNQPGQFYRLNISSQQIP